MASKIKHTRNGTEYTLNRSIARYPYIAVVIMSNPPNTASHLVEIDMPNKWSRAACAFSAKKPA